MRFITFSEGAGLRRSPGVLLDDLSTVVDLSHHYATLQDLIDAGDAGRSKAESVVASRAGRLRLADVELLAPRSEEHTSELQSLMRISYAVFCLKKKKQNTTDTLNK